ncbi:MAG TPA: AMP-binding protein [Pseudonocardiaceae bacterium]|jgi:long-chain acyl-CoA synthetase|nr:AMP-binding protein [Pseudonocardiaceae bacterium]
MTGAPADQAAAANLAELVTRAAERGPAHPALVDAASGDTLSWSEVDAAVNEHALALLDAGVQPGDRVAVRLATGVSYCLAAFGALRVGAVLVPMSLDLPSRAVGELLADCGAKILVGEGDAPVVLPSPNRVSGTSAAVEPVGGGEDIAVLCYTSGTSGVARGVLLSHRALLANVTQCAALRPAPVTAADRVLLALPLSHAYGLGPGLFQVAAAGATLVLLPRFGVEESLAAIERYRVTTLAGVPPMYSALLSVPEERLLTALSTIRLFTSGAAALDQRLSDEMRRMTGLPVFEGYGLTETGPVLTSTLVTGYAKPGSVGQPLPGVELRLVDSDGDPLPGPDPNEPLDDLGDEDGGAGLVSVRGANLFSGYWPDGTRGPDADGWFRTGDIGYLDADGDLHLVDRANDLIIVNGFNVYPHEVERVLETLAGVAEVAAVGVPDERTGETVKAIVVRAPDATLSADDVVDYCVERLARFKVPSQVEFTDKLPHSATGKLARRLLR